jgi:hypothetical protein
MQVLLQKYGWLAPILIGVFIVLISKFPFDPGLSKRTATALAEIIDVDSIAWTESGSRGKSYSWSGYRVAYRFRANGELVSAVSDKNKWYKRGEECRVCYEPANPKNNDLRDASSGSPCGVKFFKREKG